MKSGDSCWWPGCAKDASTVVTANDVTRIYCSNHAQHVERYYAVAAYDDTTDKGDLRSQGVRAEGADVVATGTSGA
jgi:hypothetical protein